MYGRRFQCRCNLIRDAQSDASPSNISISNSECVWSSLFFTWLSVGRHPRCCGLWLANASYISRFSFLTRHFQIITVFIIFIEIQNRNNWFDLKWINISVVRSFVFFSIFSSYYCRSFVFTFKFLFKHACCIFVHLLFSVALAHTRFLPHALTFSWSWTTRCAAFCSIDLRISVYIFKLDIIKMLKKKERPNDKTTITN